MPDSERLESELSRFWNELVQAGLEPDRGELPSDRAETLLRIHRMTQAPLPETARAATARAIRPFFVDEPALLSQNGHASPDWRQTEVIARSRPWGEISSSMPLTAPAVPFLPSAARRRVWASLQLAVTMLLVATLGLAYITLGPARSRPAPSAVLPVSPAVTAEKTLFEITLPAEVLPQGNQVSGALADYTLAAGEESVWEPAAGACCRGLRLTYVLERALIMRPAGPAHVLRNGVNLSPEIVPADGDVVLEPGDAILTRFEEAFVSSNRGSHPARFLDITFIEGYFPLNAAPEGWLWHPDGDVAYGMSVPNRPATLRLERVVLAPGAVLPLPPGTFTQLGVTVADDKPIDMWDQETIENINKTPVTVYVATLSPVDETNPPADMSESLETVFAATLPEAMIPAAGNLDFLVWRTALPPGIRTTNTAPIPGFQVQHVLEGELTLTAERSLQLYRSDETLGMVSGAEVPPGTPIVLHPGDTAVYPFDQEMTYDNRSSTPAELVGGGLFSGYGGWFPAEFTLIDHNEQYPVDELAPGPVQVSLVRAMLPPEGEIPVPPAGSLVFDVGAVKESDIAKRMDGSLRNIGPEDAAIYVLTLTPLGGEDTPQAAPVDP